MRALALLAAAVSALLAAAPARAQDWYFVDVAVDYTSATYADRASIRPQGGNLSRVSVFTAFPERPENGLAGLLIAMELDCGEPRGRMLLLTGYRANGSRIDDEQGSGRWNPMEPGTQAAVLHRFVCSNGQTIGSQAPVGAGLPLAHARALFARRSIAPR